LDLSLILRSANLSIILPRALQWRVRAITNFVLDLMSQLFYLPEPIVHTGIWSNRLSTQNLIRSILGADDVLSQYQLATQRRRYWFLALTADRRIDTLALFVRMFWP